MFNLQPGQGIGFGASKEIALGLGYCEPSEAVVEIINLLSEITTTINLNSAITTTINLNSAITTTIINLNSAITTTTINLNSAITTTINLNSTFDLEG